MTDKRNGVEGLINSVGEIKLFMVDNWVWWKQYELYFSKLYFATIVYYSF